MCGGTNLTAALLLPYTESTNTFTIIPLPEPSKEVHRVRTTKARDPKVQLGHPQRILELRVHPGLPLHSPEHKALQCRRILAHPHPQVLLLRTPEPKVLQDRLRVTRADPPPPPVLLRDIPVANLSNPDIQARHRKVLQRAIQPPVVRLRHSLARSKGTHPRRRRDLLQDLVDRDHQGRATRPRPEVIQVQRLRILDKDLAQASRGRLSGNLLPRQLDIHSLADLAYPSRDQVLLSQEQVRLSQVQVRHLDRVHHSRQQENICHQLMVK